MARSVALYGAGRDTRTMLRRSHLTRVLFRSAPLLALLLAATLLLPACNLRNQAGLPGARATVIYPRGMEREAERAAGRMRRGGMRVETQVLGPLGRDRTSLAVYDVGKYPDRAEELTEVLGDIGPMDVSPFRRRGSGGTDVVLWLVPADAAIPVEAVPVEAPPEDARED